MLEETLRIVSIFGSGSIVTTWRGEIANPTCAQVACRASLTPELPRFDEERSPSRRSSNQTVTDLASIDWYGVTSYSQRAESLRSVGGLEAWWEGERPRSVAPPPEPAQNLSARHRMATGSVCRSAKTKMKNAAIGAKSAAIRPIDTAPSVGAAQAALDAFEQRPWGPLVPHRRGARGAGPGIG